METNSLYHYCKLSTAIEFILADKQLLLNPMGKTNDPRENKSFAFAGLNIRSTEYFDLNKQNEIISNEIRRDSKIICFSADKSPFFGCELSRMWALYGDNHKGICIELDRLKFIDENKAKVSGNLFGKINYYELDVNRPIIHREIDHGKINQYGLTKYIRQDFRPKNIDFLFFTKNKEWESEQEHRLVYFSDLTEMEFCSIPNSLKSIHLGIDFNENYLPAIKVTCPNIPIYKMEFRDVRLSSISL